MNRPFDLTHHENQSIRILPARPQAYFEEETGGFNPETNTMVPMTISGGELGGAEIFDNITLAAEAGLLDTDKWVKQLFADRRRIHVLS